VNITKVKKSVKDFYEKFVDEYEITRFGSLKDHIANVVQLQTVSQIVRSKKAYVSLDAPCGTGRITRILIPNSQMTIALDINVMMLNRTRTKIGSSYPIEFIRGDIEYLPFRNDSFNVTTSFRIMWHVDNPKKSLSELIRVTKPDGFLIFDIMNRYSLFSFWCAVFKNRLNVPTKPSDLREIVDFLISNGMKIKKIIGVRSPLIQLFPSKTSKSPQKLAKLIYFLEKIRKPKFLCSLCTQTMIYTRKAKVLESML